MRDEIYMYRAHPKILKQLMANYAPGDIIEVPEGRLYDVMVFDEGESFAGNYNIKLAWTEEPVDEARGIEDDFGAFRREAELQQAAAYARLDREMDQMLFDILAGDVVARRMRRNKLLLLCA